MNSDRNIKNIIDTRLSALTVNENLEHKIQNNLIHKKRIVRKPLAVAAAICICVMLSVPVMATKVPAFNKLLNVVGVQGIQLLQPLELVSEDNGIKMEVLAAMNDDETAIVYLTLQDLTGDRIDQTVDLYNYSINGANAFTHELVDYNEDTKTATIRMIANGGQRFNGKKVTVRVDSFLSGKQYFNEVDTRVILADVVNEMPETIPLDMNNIPGGGGKRFDEIKAQGTVDILKLDEEKEIITLPQIDFAHISNIGYIDGKLHVQTKWKKNVDEHGSLYLQDAHSGRIDPSSISFGIDEQGNTNYGNEYIEYIFDIGPAEASSYSLFGFFVKNNNYTEGKWATTFKIEAVNNIKKIVRNVTVGNVKIDEMIIQPIGINLTGTKNEPDQMVIEMTMNDGAKVLYNHTVSSESEGKQRVKFFPNAPVDMEDMKELRINGEVIHLD